MDKPEKANDLTMMLGEEFSTLESQIQSLMTWCKEAKISQKKVEDNTKKLKNLQLKDAQGDGAETPRRSLFGVGGKKENPLGPGQKIGNLRKMGNKALLPPEGLA